MSELNKIRRCYNCGAILQSSDPKSPGYVKKETLENATQNFIFCDECFEKERFKQELSEPFLNDNFITLLKDAKKKNALIVYVINLFSFEASFNKEINDLINDMNIIVVANKFDLLPVNVNKEKVRLYVTNLFKSKGFTHIKEDDVLIANAFDDETIKEIMTVIYERKNKKDVFLIGPSLSGKSTLVSAFLRNFKNLTEGNIIKQPYLHTNLNVTRIPLNKSTAIYDTPGLGIENSILYNVDKTTFKQIYITKAVKERNYIMLTNQSLFIGGLAIFEIISSENKRTNVSCYFSDSIQIKRNYVKLNSLDDAFIKLINKKILKPSMNRINSVKDLDVYEMHLNKTQDIGILGLGWINVKTNNAKIRMCVPKGISIFVNDTKAEK